MWRDAWTYGSGAVREVRGLGDGVGVGWGWGALIGLVVGGSGGRGGSVLQVGEQACLNLKLPWCNRTGWLGVKHQITYLLYLKQVDLQTVDEERVWNITWLSVACRRMRAPGWKLNRCILFFIICLWIHFFAALKRGLPLNFVLVVMSPH